MTSFLLGLIFICFANEEAVSRWFCSSSIPNVVVSTVFVHGGLGCAFLADQVLSDRQSRSCWLWLCTILRAFHPGSHLNNLTFCSFFLVLILIFRAEKLLVTF